MAQTKQVDRETATAAYVEIALDDAFGIREEYDSLLVRRAANRTTLRSLMAQGKLDDEQAATVVELYPFKHKGGDASNSDEPEAA